MVVWIRKVFEVGIWIRKVFEREMLIAKEFEKEILIPKQLEKNLSIRRELVTPIQKDFVQVVSIGEFGRLLQIQNVEREVGRLSQEVQP